MLKVRRAEEYHYTLFSHVMLPKPPDFRILQNCFDQVRVYMKGTHSFRIHSKYVQVEDVDISLLPANYSYFLSFRILQC